MPKQRYDIIDDLNEAEDEFPDTAALTQILEDIQHKIKKGGYEKDFEAAGFGERAYDSWADTIYDEAETILKALSKAEHRLGWIQREVQDAFQTSIDMKRMERNWK